MRGLCVRTWVSGLRGLRGLRFVCVCQTVSGADAGGLILAGADAYGLCRRDWKEKKEIYIL